MGEGANITQDNMIKLAEENIALVCINTSMYRYISLYSHDLTTSMVNSKLSFQCDLYRSKTVFQSKNRSYQH